MLTHQFHFPIRNGKPATYLCGHSLGLQPTAAAGYVQQELERWATLGVDGHFQGKDPWLTFHESLSIPSAELVGAHPEEVSVQNTLSVNIHLLLASFYRPVGKKTKVLMEAPAFPSDQYAVETHLKLRGYDPDEHVVEMGHDQHNYCLSNDEICQTIENHADELALVFLGGVQYISGQTLDMRRIAETARRCGVLVGFDLAHAAGNVRLRLSEWGVDFACWCNYKYLNGGPGTLGSLYINRSHLEDESIPRLAGWWGYRKETRFKMAKGFQPTADADSWALSNPPILSMAALKASLPMFTQAGLDNLRQQSSRLTGSLRSVLGEIPGVEILTPTSAQTAEGNTGAMLAFRHAQARALFEHLQSEGVIGDWREPGIIRLAPAPIYNSEADVMAVGQALEKFAAVAH